VKVAQQSPIEWLRKNDICNHFKETISRFKRVALTMCAGGSVFVRDWLYTSALVALKRRVLRQTACPLQKSASTGSNITSHKMNVI
jgi:hypothetical protein